MSYETSAKEARELFDELSTEIYYGFNMRVVLAQLIAEGSLTTVPVLKQFVKTCRVARDGLRKEATI